jgi:hypothetical protein
MSVHRICIISGIIFVDFGVLAGCCTAPPEQIAEWPATVTVTPAVVPAAVPREMPRPKPKPPSEPVEPKGPAMPPERMPKDDEPVAPPVPDVGWLVGQPGGFLLANLGDPVARKDGWFVSTWTYRIEDGFYCLALRRDRTTYEMIVASVEPAACPA